MIKKVIERRYMLLSVLILIMAIYGTIHIRNCKDSFWMGLSWVMIVLQGIAVFKIHFSHKNNDVYVLEEEVKSYALAIKGSSDLFFEYDIKNKKFELFGNAMEEGQNFNYLKGVDIIQFYKYIFEGDKDVFMRSLKKCLRQYQDLNLDLRLIHPKKHQQWVHIRGKIAFNDYGLPAKIGGAMTDISSSKKDQESIKKLAYYDMLTELPNKQFFYEQFQEHFKNCGDQRAAVLFIDMDNFKQVNDMLGHVYGDQLIKLVAELLKIYFSKDSIIGRFGGDEFVVLMKNIKNREQIEACCKNIIKVFTHPLEIGNKNVYSSLSIGISRYPEDGKNIDLLLKYADMAMYKSKDNGKNQYAFFDFNIKRGLERRADIELNLRNAIEKNEFSLFYQPQLNMKDKKVGNLEVLLRWQCKVLGNVCPDEFIPIAEEIGLIDEIGEWVLKESCKVLSKWRKAGIYMGSISINLSAKQTANILFPELVRYYSNLYEIPCSLLEFEITETALFKNINDAKKTILKLMSFGCSVALDDFGVEYASLNYLRVLPLNRLKVDKIFLHKLSYVSSSAQIIKGMIDIAHNIQMTVVVEGVETKDQFNMIDQLGADYIQGYYFAKPKSDKDIVAFLAN